ncbi:MAG: Ig-like domain-containing protein, partial [Bacteroidia bacterium]
MKKRLQSLIFATATVLTTAFQFNASAQNCSVNANIDVIICANQVMNLQGNSSGLISGTTKWVQLSGPAAIIDNPTALISTVSSFTAGVYKFRLTAKCTDGNLIGDDVTITVKPITISTILSSAQASCPGSLSVMANTPAVGETGAWSGAGLSFASSSSPSTTVTLPTGSAGVIPVTWTITGSNGCSSVATPVNITNYGGVSPVTAGADQTLSNCYTATQSASLSGSFGGNGTGGQAGTWMQVSGPAYATIASVNSENTSVSNLIEGTYVFRWTVAGQCVNGTDDVSIVVPAATQNVTGVWASWVSFCTSSATTAVLEGALPEYANETVTWTQLTGPAGAVIVNPNSPSTKITGLDGNSGYTFSYSLVNSVTGCNSSATGGIYYTNTAPSMSLGADVIGTCNQTTFNIPYTANGGEGRRYTIISGPSNVGDVNGLGGSWGAQTASIYLGSVGTYVLRFETYANGISCGSAFDDIQITVSTTPSASNAGTTQNLACNVVSTSLAGNSPASGIGSWSQVSGPNTATLATPNTPSCGVSGLVSGVYVFKWIISNGVGCAPKSANVTIRVATPLAVGAANAGADQNACAGSSINLLGNVPPAGATGAWTVSPSGPTIANVNNPLSKVTGLTASTVYTFTWTITNSCGSVNDAALVTVGSGVGPTIANAGTDKCVASGTTSVAMTGNTIAVGTGTWSLVSGPNVPTITSPNVANTTVTGLVTGTYLLNWSSTNAGCQTTSDTVVVTINSSTTTANAGADQITCGSTLTLAGNTATIGTGRWTQSVGPGGSTITTPSLATSTVTGLASGIYRFVWTISNGACTSTKDSVDVTINATPTVANAGADQLSVCNTTTVTLAGNTATVGTGYWTLVNTANGSPTITNANSPTSTITGLVTGAYTFRWTISNGAGCTPTFDDVLIQISAPANAGADQNYCSRFAVQLIGTDGSTGTWTQITAAPSTITANSGYTATATLTPNNNYTFQYTADPIYGCASTNDQVSIVNSQFATTPNANIDQSICLTSGSTITLAGNVPTIGTGMWSLEPQPTTPTGSVITTPSLFNTTVTGLTQGLYIFNWNIGNANCGTFKDVVRINAYNAPTVANAGADNLNACETGFKLSANLPINGLGTWTQVSGPNTANFGFVNQPTSTVTGVIPGTYVFRWTIANGPVCVPSVDEVTITFPTVPPTTPNAGLNQDLCNLTASTFAGNVISPGVGTWSLASGPAGATISATTTNNSSVTGLIAGTYNFVWTATNGGCTVTDTVKIINSPLPTVAAAGTDQTLCPTQIPTLTANVPTAGIGMWSQVSGPNTAIIVTPNSNTTKIAGTIPGVYELQWSITSGACTPSTDNVLITIQANCAPVAVNETISTNEDNTYTVSLPNVGGILNNGDTDPDGDILTVGAVLLAPANGTFTNNANGTYSYVPNTNFNGKDTAIVSICDDRTPILCTNDTVFITVNPINDPPVAVLNTTSTAQNTPVTLPAIQLNDTDLDGNVVVGTIDLDPAQAGQQLTFANAEGSWSVNTTTGNVLYTPALNFNATATINYTITDNNGAVSNVANLSVNVSAFNAPPVALNDTMVTPQNIPVSTNIITNDSDADGGINPASVDLDLTQAGIQNTFVTANGTYSVTATGVITFTQNDTTWFGQDSLKYTLLDVGGASSNVATVFVTVLADHDYDGVPDIIDLDDDNDGVLDTTEGIADNDNDGVPNNIDLDSDNDGITDVTEANNPSAVDANGDGVIDGFVADANGVDVAHTAGLTPQDKDGDGLPNYLDLDADNDGIADVVEAGGIDANNDGVPDSFNDTDDDGLSDVVDPTTGGTKLTIGDLDGDGLPNYLDLDSDNDGIADVIEAGGTDPDNNGYASTGASNTLIVGTNGWINEIDGNDSGTALAIPNSDNNGLPNYLDRDSDNDGISDATEYFQGNTSGLNDTENDGVIDNTAGTGTAGQGIFADTDGDGWSDLVDEVTVTYNAQHNDTDHDKDNDSKPNYMDIDSDSDGITDSQEAGYFIPDAENDGIAASSGLGMIADADGDGLADAFDIMSNTATYLGSTYSSLFNQDREGDGLENYLDIDADNDGIVDNTEGQATSTYAPPTNLDTDGDGLDNAYDVNQAGVAVGYVNTDGGSAPDYVDTDADNDGIRDIKENLVSDALDIDVDNNGILDAASFVDSDNDGLADVFDVTLTATSNLTTTNNNATNGGQNPATQPDTQQPGADRDWRDNLDADLDGVADNVDIDDDNDGVTDVEEGMIDLNIDGLPDNLLDADGDGVANWDDLDSDNDGITDVIEAGGIDPDKDGHPGTSTEGIATPVDVNGLPAILAAIPVSTLDAGDDFDGDGNPNFLDLDSDNDGIQDVIEAGGIDPDGDGHIGAGVANDVDSDGLSDIVDTINELLIDGLAGNNAGALTPIPGIPLPNADFDGDGNLNVYDLDSDNDGVADVIEAGGTDPDGNGIIGSGLGNTATDDTDGDGWNNPADADNGGTALPVPNTDAIGGANFLDLDSDNDGITDIRENGLSDPDNNGIIGTGPSATIIDANNNGLEDIMETIVLSLPNADGSGLPNYADIDADDDGIVDAIEAVATGTTISNSTTDTDGDGISDVYDIDPTIGGAGTVPVNTDGIDTPDYIDLDSDNDLKTDAIEGHDNNGDGVADVVASGIDVDKDGLDDAFDNDTTLPTPANGQTSSSFPNLDNTITAERDWREVLDTDGDGVPNLADLDDDNDGILDAAEGIADTDKDGKPDTIDLDSDNDGIPDVTEAGGLDPDNDGVLGSGPVLVDANGQVLIVGTPVALANLDTDGDNVPNSKDLDADNDGIYDVIESGANLVDANNDGIVDGTDTDGDGLINVAGLDSTTNTTFGGTIANVLNTDGDSSPNYLDLDADNDGILDLTEAGTNLPDGNNDGVVDGIDNDGDGLINVLGLDANVVFGGTNTTPPIDSDGDGVVNTNDLDADNDGIYDVTENGNASLDTDGNGVINGTDTDGDGIINVLGIDTNATFGGTTTAPLNADNDVKPNYIDIDADNDGITDVVENGNGALDANNDGMIDGTDLDKDGILSSLDTIPLFGGATQVVINTDADANANYLDIDADNDGLLDINEAQPAIGVIAPTGLDSDGDGLDNAFDNIATAFGGAGLTPLNTDGDTLLPNYIDIDSDNDGITDVIEAGGIDPDNDGELGTGNTQPDTDNDGLIDTADTNNGGTALPNLDTDNDGKPNYLDIDADNDGIIDNVEAQLSGAGFIPASGNDTDGDGLDDAYDATIAGGVVMPLTNSDTLDTKPDYLDIDADNDGIVDNVEGQTTLGYIAPTGLDTDGDGLDNAYDNLTSTGILVVNTDTLDMPDYRDTDADNDGLSDLIEGNDFNNDGTPDVPFVLIDTDNDGLVDAYDVDGVSATNAGGAANNDTPTSFPDVHDVNVVPTPERDWREINAPPVANLDVATTNEDTPINIAVLTNDTDADGQIITSNANVTITDAPNNGTATVGANGSINYTPNTNFNGIDTLIYNYCDAGTPQQCDTAMVIINVTSVNDSVIANQNTIVTNEDTPATINVLANDTDVDNNIDAASVVIVDAPNHGIVTVDNLGNITYIPNNNYFGPDTLIYNVCDLGTPVYCDTAIVIINVTSVNDAPIVVDDAATTAEDTPIAITILGNDTDVDGAIVPSNVTVLDSTNHGTITINSDGTISYVPNSNYNGVDTLMYQYCDGGTPSLCDTAIVVITVTPVNDAPVATLNSGSTDEDTPITIAVLGNDIDVDNPLNNPHASTLAGSNPTNGTVVYNADGTITYTPNANYNGPDSFIYEICDNGTPQMCDTAIVYINVLAVPDAKNDTATVKNGTSVAIPW